MPFYSIDKARRLCGKIVRNKNTLSLLHERTYTMSRSSLHTEFLGYDVPYAKGLARMNELHAKVVAGAASQLLFLEHTDTITTTALHADKSLLLTREEIARKGIEIVQTDRGGDVTFHGKGQLVGYFMTRLPKSLLQKHNQYVYPVDLHAYVRKLESALLRTCKILEIDNAHCKAGKSGIWIDNSKIIAIGIGVRQGVTKHGFALNVSTDLLRFQECIIPCGLAEMGITSLNLHLAAVPSWKEIQQIIAENIQIAFELTC